MLKTWSTAGSEAADDAGLEETAAELGKTPAEMMTIASLIQAEGRGNDMPKISRVIYNRLDGPGDKAAPTAPPDRRHGRLRARTAAGSSALTPDETRRADSPTTPTSTPVCRRPRSSRPGDDAIAGGAANPADGDWYYYVTVNLATGETKFADDYEGFLEVQATSTTEYCETSDRC